MIALTNKLKLSIAAGLIIAVASGGLWYWRVRTLTGSVVSSGGAPVVLDRRGEPKTIPLDKSSDEKTEGNSLKVTAAQDLGQTGFSLNSDNSGSTSKELSPDEFMVYEKYKTEQNTLFGEIKAGSGAEAAAGKKVAVAYRGWLTDGRLFDESKDGSPFVFTIGEHRVIPGWEQGIIGMKVGGKRLLIVPPAMGYGAEGRSPIPSNAVLIFEVELVAAQP